MIFLKHLCNAHWNVSSLVSNLPLYSYLLLCSMIGVVKLWPLGQSHAAAVFVRFYWNIATFTYSHIVYGRFCVIVVEE